MRSKTKSLELLEYFRSPTAIAKYLDKPKEEIDLMVAAFYASYPSASLKEMEAKYGDAIGTTKIDFNTDKVFGTIKTGLPCNRYKCAFEYIPCLDCCPDCGVRKCSGECDSCKESCTARNNSNYRDEDDE